MKTFTVTAALGMLFAMSFASAATTHYVLEVQGVKCAFCAYNAAEQLARIDGVHPQTVRVDVSTGTASLTSDTPLGSETLAHALENAGFRLVEIRTTPVPEDEHTIKLRTVMQLEIDLSDGDESRFGPVLEALGSMVAAHGGQVRVHAPASMEKVLVKSLLMAKPVTVPVRFEPSPSRTNAVVEWQQPSDQ